MSGADSRARVVNVRERPHGRVVLMRVENADTQRALLVKMRRSVGRPALVGPSGSRPELRAPGSGDDHRDCELEYKGMQAIDETFSGLHDSRFEVVRPYACNGRLAAISMQFSFSPTLRELARSDPARYSSDLPWRHTAGWLRHFHESVSIPGSRSSRSTADEITQTLQQYGEFLSARTPDRDVLMRFVDAVSQRADRDLPQQLPMALGHGDFVPSNILFSQSAAISVIDPLPARRVPIYEDLARLLVGGRLLARRHVRSGLRGPRLPEPAVLTGYFGDGPVPVRPMRLFLALATLDRWADMVSRQPADLLSRRRRDLHLVVMHQYFRGELRRQLETLHGGDDARWERSG